MRLALDMQASRLGLSLADIEERLGVGRRTAMRLRDAVRRAFPEVEVLTGDGLKRWRLPPGTLDRLARVSADELAALDLATRLLLRDNCQAEAEALAGLATKLMAVLKPAEAARVGPDLDALLEAEGLALRPGPRPRIGEDVLVTLRTAIKGCRNVRFTYRRRGGSALTDRTVSPLGLLHGHRHYLVARREMSDSIALFSLAAIADLELTSDSFVRDPNFRLSDYAAQAFGVFQGKAIETMWRFTAEAAEAAAEFVFHPHQAQEPQADGSLIVRFTAAGELEMAWHLLQWGTAVEVLAPPSLASLVNPRRVAWPALP